MTGGAVAAIDWGTTNRRAFLLDRAGGVVRREADDRGITAIAPAAFESEITGLRQRFGDGPFLLAGMIGSNRGWREAPYIPCPVTLPMLAERLLWIEPGRTAIVPGACVDNEDRADVMRGEEVQLLGAAAAGLVPPDATLCLPGTHSKWAVLRGGALVDFRTTMTGELFALLRRHSLLATQVGGDATDSPAFREGVRRGHGDARLLSDLFGVRARLLLGRSRAEDGASHLSGLLIGADLREGLGDAAPGPVALIGDPMLTTLYGAALAEIGCSYTRVDGEQAFVAGIHAISEMIA